MATERKLTKTGSIFKKLAEKIVLKYGCNSTKTIEGYNVDDCREYQQELEWLVDNGYLFRYEKCFKQRQCHISTYFDLKAKHGEDHFNPKTYFIYGLTKKGWDVSRHYVDAEKIEKIKVQEAKERAEAEERRKQEEESQKWLINSLHNKKAIKEAIERDNQEVMV